MGFGTSAGPRQSAWQHRKVPAGPEEPDAMTPATAARPDPRQALSAMRAAVARLAEALYRIDADPDLTLARDHARLRGRSAVLAGEVAARSERLWERYPLAKAAVDELEQAVHEGDEDVQARLLGPGAVDLLDGSRVALADVLAELEADADRVTAAGGELGRAWRTTLPRLDALASQLRSLAATAADLGIVDDPDLVAARVLVDQLASRAATDPLDVDPAPAERAVEHATGRLEELASSRATLPADLAAARARLDELVRLIVEGRDALAAATARVAGTAGLLQPLDPSALGEGDLALRPWLSRLEAEAAAGKWAAAGKGLERWREVADGWLANARRVVAANQAPLRRRDDLRGLLDAYRAKAAATGLAEDAAVTALYREASDALYTAPCDLDAADILVRRYTRAVNDAAPRSRR